MSDEYLDVDCIDFETEAIDGAPSYSPPKPVGVSLKVGDSGSEYLAWGHPTGNNVSWEDARARTLGFLHRADKKDGWLAHNAAFESAVLGEYFGYKAKNPLKVHDSMFLLFLTNPYAMSFALKPSAERELGIPPEEQTNLMTWVLQNVPGATPKTWGAHISKAPAELCAPYANGDTDRAKLLFNKLYPRMMQMGMLEAYRREQKLSPILADSTKRGVRLDMERLGNDIETYGAAMKMAEDYVHGKLGDFNIDSDRELADALDRAKMVDDWVLTPTGKRSTARKNLVGRVRDPDLLNYMAYRGVLATCLGTFAGPWLEQALKEGGRLHPSWNQTRGEKGADGDISGTKTGRMSCKAPNLQNPPNDFESLTIPDGIASFLEGQAKATGRIIHPVMHMRQYLLPEEGHTWVKRDFSAQEMRVMSHYAEGSLFEAFIKDPTTDPHNAVMQIIKDQTGITMLRRHVKIIGFGIMYGMGADKLASSMGVDKDEGTNLRNAYFGALPEIRELSLDTRNRGKRGEYIRTWGGRVYYREPNPERDLSYKLLNYLIQGSSADQTKQSMIDYDNERNPDELLIAAVHDELNTSVPTENLEAGMVRLRTAMDKDRFDVPFRSEGYAGPNWADIEKYEPPRLEANA
jgi:DNA polymerase-1